MQTNTESQHNSTCGINFYAAVSMLVKLYMLKLLNSYVCIVIIHLHVLSKPKNPVINDKNITSLRTITMLSCMSYMSYMRYVGITDPC